MGIRRNNLVLASFRCGLSPGLSRQLHADDDLGNGDFDFFLQLADDFLFHHFLYFFINSNNMTTGVLVFTLCFNSGAM